MPRRRLLQTAGILGAGGFAGFATSGVIAPLEASAAGPLAPVSPVGSIDRSTFAANEQILATYLVLVEPIANSVVDDNSPERGWMADGWWRSPTVPYNARIQEHVSTLALFATLVRPWNPYKGNAALIARLDAALVYYLGLQHPDGSWPEQRENEMSLAATGFGTIALAKTYQLLTAGAILTNRLAALEAALRSACGWLGNPAVNDRWDHPLVYSNQNNGGLDGIAKTAAVLGDSSVAAALDARLGDIAAYGTAPAGYWHEPYTCDPGYNFEVMLPDVASLYRTTGKTAASNLVRDYADYVAHAAMPEPDGQGSVFGYSWFSSAGSRTALDAISFHADDESDKTALTRSLLTVTPGMRPYFVTSEEKAAARAAWSSSTDPVPVPEKGDTSPRLWMHVSEAPAGISTSQRTAAIAALKINTDLNFTELRLGTNVTVPRQGFESGQEQHLFVRRPNVYSATLLGDRQTNLNRMGAGAVWHPTTGCILQGLNSADASQDGRADHYWTTRNQTVDLSAEDALAVFHEGPDGTSTAELSQTQVRAHDGVFSAAWTSSGVTSSTSYWPNAVVRNVAGAGTATDIIPLTLAPTDVVIWSTGASMSPGGSGTVQASGVRVQRNGVSATVSWGSDRTVSWAPGNSVHAGRRQHHLLRISHSGSLRTVVAFTRDSAITGPVPIGAVVRKWLGIDGGRRIAVLVTNFHNRPVDVTISVPARADKIITGLARWNSGQHVTGVASYPSDVNVTATDPTTGAQTTLLLPVT